MTESKHKKRMTGNRRCIFCRNEVLHYECLNDEDEIDFTRPSTWPEDREQNETFARTLDDLTQDAYEDQRAEEAYIEFKAEHSAERLGD